MLCVEKTGLRSCSSFAHRDRHSPNLHIQLVHKEVKLSTTVGRQDISQVKIGIKEETVDQVMMQGERPAHGAEIVILNHGNEADFFTGLDELMAISKAMVPPRQ